MMRARVAAVSLAVAASVSVACAPAMRMCTAPTECGGAAACVGGRCVPSRGTPAIQGARRILFAPVDAAFVRRGDRASAAPPSFVTVGRAEDGESILLLRFRVPLTKNETVLEAYLVLERSSVTDVDPVPLTLRTARIVDPWDGRSTSWARLPRIEATRSPSTTVDPAGRAVIRLDVRALVQGWRAHAERDQGIAVVADNATPSGMAIAMSSVDDATLGDADPFVAPPPSSFEGFGAGTPSAIPRADAALRQGPRLELYVK